MRLLPTVLLIGLLVPCPGSGQEAFRIFGGAAMRGDYRTGWGGHGGVEYSLFPDARGDVRGAASFAAGGFPPNHGPVLGIDAVALLRLGGFYLGAGPGYSFSDNPYSPGQFSEGLGPTGVLGYQHPLGGAVWSLELRGRSWGNYLNDGVTQSVILVSVGRSVG